MNPSSESVGESHRHTVRMNPSSESVGESHRHTVRMNPSSEYVGESHRHTVSADHFSFALSWKCERFQVCGTHLGEFLMNIPIV